MFGVAFIWDFFYLKVYRLGLSLVEKGLLPDFLIRCGIRYLLTDKLRTEGAGSTADIVQRKQELVEKFKTLPIAVETKTANVQHYEVSTEYFELCLGKWKKYSSCLYLKPEDSLQTAEENMMSLYCKKASVQDGMKLLDLGCGWGSLSLFLATAYPNSQVTGVSNSQTQKKYIEESAKTLGLKNVEILTCDINEFHVEEKFDRILSIEMFEHMKNYKLLLHKISAWLKPDGQVFVHYFCHKTFLYEFKVSREDDWMAKYFFTGGTMPSLDLLLHFQDDLVVKKIEYLNGVTYSKTLEAWLKKMDVNKTRVQSIFKATYGEESKKWFVYWRLFYLACSELFRFNNGEEWGIGHVLLEHKKA